MFALSDLHVDYPANKSWLAQHLDGRVRASWCGDSLGLWEWSMAPHLWRVDESSTATSTSTYTSSATSAAQTTPAIAINSTSTSSSSRPSYNREDLLAPRANSCPTSSGGYGVTRGGTLLVAGDVTHDLVGLETCMRDLIHIFEHVFFVPGNHELWMREGDTQRGLHTSIDKFHEILRLCSSIGVHTSPQIVNGVHIFPLFSWYDLPGSEHTLFAPNPALDSSEDVWSDTHLCKWPSEMEKHSRSKYFIDQNQPNLNNLCTSYPIVTMSHFFSCKELMRLHTEITMQRYLARVGKGYVPPASTFARPNFSVCAGTTLLDPIIQKLRPKLHIFGHSHRPLEVQIDGITYINYPLGYPQERSSALITMGEPFLPLNKYLTSGGV
ncbi:ser/thr phosphatase family protein [Pelomyxa schiedti]|nr:ser/thr phosphatase family protein [Pelomyxa schiedti]